MVEAKALALSRKVFCGFLTLTLPFSMAVLNLAPGMVSSVVSSLTFGVVYCSSLIVKGSNPATIADVSMIIALLPVLSEAVFTASL